MNENAVNHTSVHRRLVRREQYRSRSRAVIIALALMSLGLAYVGTESVLAALGLAPLLVAPDQAVDGINTPTMLVTIGAGAAMLFGLVLVVLALAPGRRARHAVPHARMAVVVDDNVLAGALGRAARVAASVPADRVRTTVSARRARVAVTPSSGFPIDRASVSDATDALTAALAPTPRVRVAVAVAPSGVVGS